jgi:iron complex transport system substrate-binding protein
LKLRNLALLLTAAAVLAAMLVACGGDDEADSGTATATPEATLTGGTFPVTIIDDDGDNVRLEQAAERIVALAPSYVEILFEIGAGELVVAVDENSDYPPDAVAGLPKLSGFDPSVEAIVAEDPDAVLIQFDPGGLKDALQSNGIAVFSLASPDSLMAVYQQIHTIGRISGHAGESQQLVSEMQAEIELLTDGIPEGTERPRVFHEVDNTLYTVGPGSFIHDMYVVLGAKNIAEDTGEAFPQLTEEAIINADPQVIILADEEFGESAETVAGRPGWDQISAVKDGRVHGADPDIFSRPGPRLAEAMEILKGYLYPEEPA